MLVFTIMLVFIEIESSAHSAAIRAIHAALPPHKINGDSRKQADRFVHYTNLVCSKSLLLFMYNIFLSLLSVTFNMHVTLLVFSSESWSFFRKMYNFLLRYI